MIKLKNLTPRRKVRYEPRGRRLRALSRDSLVTETNDEVELIFDMSYVFEKVGNLDIRSINVTLAKGDAKPN